MTEMINFTPGPSQLYFTVEQHLRTALRENVASLSHRSKAFESIFADTTSGLRKLLGIPEDFHIFFTGSATEIWERSIQNLVEDKSLHFVNGAFSKRYYEIAQQLQKHPVKIESPAGKGFAANHTVYDTELLALTHNETSTGVMLPLSFIDDLKKRHPEALLVVDAVSSMPYPQFDFSLVDSCFFSVQKGFGLPAGLGVWIVNDRCIAKANALAAKGVAIGTYHNLPTLLANGKKNQTPETPNVLFIYLLGKVVEDMLEKGVERIRKETEYKANVLYYALHAHPELSAVVTDKEFQSQTVITVECGAHLPKVSQTLTDNGFSPGDGYGEFKKTQLRFANFPTHSKETFEKLADVISAIKL